jgi:hypothetical protein
LLLDSGERISLSHTCRDWVICHDRKKVIPPGPDEIRIPLEPLKEA